jgi:hypothetical protein
MNFLRVCVIAACLLGPHAARSQNTPFFSMMLQALDSKEGQVTRRFEKTLPWVVEMRRQFGTLGAVTVTTKVVKRYEQEGCARFENEFRIHEAEVKGGAFQDARFLFSFNSCRDGQPPTEALDLSTVKRIVDSQNPAPPTTLR